MTGPEHYQQAERYLELARTLNGPRDTWLESEVLAMQQQAQAHATLALTAATALHPGNFDHWYDVAGPKGSEVPGA